MLASLDVTLEEVRAQVARIIALGEAATPGELPFTPRARRVLEHAARAAAEHVEPEHILIGLVREPGGVAARILLGFGGDEDRIRAELAAQADEPGREPAPAFEPALALVRAATEAALAAQELGRAEKLREIERRLQRLARSHRHELGGARAASAGATPRVWEFRVVDLAGDAAASEATLNELGAQGWELAWLGDEPARATFQRKVGG